LLSNQKILQQKQQDIDKMAKTKAQQAAIAISMKRAGKTPKMAKGGTAKSCWPGYEKKGTKKMYGKTYNNCVKK